MAAETTHILPAGRYRCRVSSATEDKSGKLPNSWALLFEVTEGPHTGAIIRDDLQFGDKGHHRVTRFLDAVGLAIPIGKTEADPSIAQTRELLVDLQVVEHGGGQRSVVACNGYHPPPPPPRPTILKPDPSGILDELKARRRWVCWKLALRRDSNGAWKWKKLPLRARDGQNAATTLPDDWDSFDAAWARYQAGGSDGVGFVFTEEDGLVGVDLDHAVEGGELTPWAREITDQLHSFTETSIRGEGIHIIGRGVLPPGRRRSGSIEVYSTARYFVMSGAPLNGFPREIMEFNSQALSSLIARMDEPTNEGTGEVKPCVDQPAKTAASAPEPVSDDELLHRAFSARNGQKVRALWEGTDNGYPSPSEGDLALLAMLCFWTGPDVERLDSLFRRSSRMRAKWDERHGNGTYGEITIARAIQGSVKFYDWHRGRGDEAATAACASKAGAPEPFEPFPVESLPDLFAQYATAAAEAIGCDTAHVALPLVAVVAGAIGNTRAILLKSSWMEPSVVWCSVVAPSGAWKSPGLHSVLSRVYAIQAAALTEYREQHAEWERTMREYQEAMDDYRRKRGSSAQRPERPEESEPRPVEYIVDDITTESLGINLRDNPRGLLGAPEELSGWYGAMNCYKQGARVDAPRWLRMYDARPMKINRKTGDKADRIIFVRRPAVSLVGTIQPGILARCATTEEYDSGLMARFILAAPPVTRPEWTEATVPPDLEDRLLRLFRQLYALKGLREDGEEQLAEEDVQSIRPHALYLVSEAKRAWVKFFNEFRFEEDSEDPQQSALWAKTVGRAARLALLHHVVSEITAGRDATAPIQLESMEAGITLARWSLHEGERVYRALRAEARKAAGDDTTPVAKDEDTALVAWIASRGGAITARELQRGPRRYRESGVDPEALLQRLVSRGLGTWGVRKPESGPGRPTKVFRLSPPASTGDTIQLTGDEIGAFPGENANSVTVAASPGGSSSQREPGDEPSEDTGGTP